MKTALWLVATLGLLLGVGAAVLLGRRGYLVRALFRATFLGVCVLVLALFFGLALPGVVPLESLPPLFFAVVLFFAPIGLCEAVGASRVRSARGSLCASLLMYPVAYLGLALAFVTLWGAPRFGWLSASEHLAWTLLVGVVPIQTFFRFEVKRRDRFGWDLLAGGATAALLAGAIFVVDLMPWGPRVYVDYLQRVLLMVLVVFGANGVADLIEERVLGTGIFRDSPDPHASEFPALRFTLSFLKGTKSGEAEPTTSPRSVFKRRVSVLWPCLLLLGCAITLPTVVRHWEFASHTLSVKTMVLSAVLIVGAAVFVVLDLRRSKPPLLYPIPLWAALGGIALGVLTLSTESSLFLEPRRSGNETGAIGALKTIGTAQSLFREADKEGDGNLDYGTLRELSTAGEKGLIDSILSSGTKDGYVFEATYGSMSSEFIWFATARPEPYGFRGHRYFCTNHEGVTYYTTKAPFKLNSINCTIPAGARTVGR